MKIGSVFVSMICVGMLFSRQENGVNNSVTASQVILQLSEEFDEMINNSEGNSLVELHTFYLKAIDQEIPERHFEEFKSSMIYSIYAAH